MKITTGTSVGFFFVLGLVVLLLIMEMLSGGAGFTRGYVLRTYFQNAREIKVGSPIKMGGVQIGKVSDIILAGPGERGQVQINLKIRPDVKVRTDAEASIMLSSLFGENFVDISFGKPDSPTLNPNSVINSRERTDMNAMIDKMEEVANDVRSLTKQLNESSPLGPLTDFFKENQPKFTNLLSNAEKISQKVAAGEGTVGKLISDPSLFDEAKKMLTEFQKTNTDLQELGSNLKGITGDLRQGKGTIGKFLHEEEFYNQANHAVQNLNEILRKINEGKGSIGELVNDPALMRNAKVSLQKLDKASDSIEDQGPLSIISILVGQLF